MPAGIVTTIDIKGLDELLKNVRSLPGEKSQRILRHAMEAATEPMLAEATARCPVSTDLELQPGLLKKSMGRKIKTYPRSKSVVVIVGPRTGFKVPVSVREVRVHGLLGGRTRRKIVYQNPTQYAHLVEFGHAGPHPAPAHPFMRPAFDGTKQAFRSILESKLAAGLAKELGS